MSPPTWAACRPGILQVWGALVAIAASAAVARAGTWPSGSGSLPTTLVGEAATVALGFTFPALAAGCYIALKSLARRTGALGAIVTVTAGVAVIAATTAAVHRPDLLGWLATVRPIG
jgi:hypothetical protein